MASSESNSDTELNSNNISEDDSDSEVESKCKAGVRHSTSNRTRCSFCFKAITVGTVFIYTTEHLPWSRFYHPRCFPSYPHHTSTALETFFTGWTDKLTDEDRKTITEFARSPASRKEKYELFSLLDLQHIAEHRGVDYSHTWPKDVMIEALEAEDDNNKEMHRKINSPKRARTESAKQSTRTIILCKQSKQTKKDISSMLNAKTHTYETYTEISKLCKACGCNRCELGYLATHAMAQLYKKENQFYV